MQGTRGETRDPVLPPPLSARAGAIVLVHGAWVGEWCWLPVEPELAASGRGVHAVSLTGHGTRRHESGPHVTLEDHVRDVIGVIETHDLVDITLVGHSYGGRVVTQVCARVPERIRSVVYLDAHAPVAPDPGQPPERVAAAEAHGGMLPLTDYLPDAELLGDESAVEWFLERTVPHSFAAFADPWQAELAPELHKVFVFATGYGPSRFEGYADACRADPGWEYHEIAGSHWLMMSHPAEVARLILEA